MSKNAVPFIGSTDESFEKQAIHVTNISIIGNTALTLFKFFAGIFAASGAMISDAVHSASDILSSVIVIIGVKIAGKASDEEHPYGHERYESAAAIVLAVILCITGVFIGHTAIEKLSSGDSEIQQPGLLALIAAVVSIVTKEAMYRYTRHHAKRLDSGALMADAWHHRSDALSSIGALIGIAGARMGYPKLDAVASLVICGFIIKAAYDVFADAIEKMVDHACSRELQEEMRACAASQEGVLGIDRLRTRQFGNKVYVDIEICADGNQTLNQSHAIAEQVHRAIERQFPKVKHIMVHVNPKAEDTDPQ